MKVNFFGPDRLSRGRAASSSRAPAAAERRAPILVKAEGAQAMLANGAAWSTRTMSIGQLHPGASIDWRKLHG